MLSLVCITFDGFHTVLFLLRRLQASDCVECILQVKCEVIEKKIRECERRVISMFFVSKCCMLHGQSFSGNVGGKYSLSEVLIEWSTHWVKYSLSEILIDWSTHSVKYSFSEAEIQWSTNPVNYSFIEVLIQRNSHSVKFWFSEVLN